MLTIIYKSICLIFDALVAEHVEASKRRSVEAAYLLSCFYMVTSTGSVTGNVAQRPDSWFNDLVAYNK